MAPEIAADARGPIVDGGELVESAEVDTEVRPKVPVASPTAPTASQLAEHRDGGHIQYRNWCDDCVEAFGLEDPHEAKDKLTGRTVPVISLDYLFVTPKAVYTFKDFEAAEPELFAQREDHPDVMKGMVMFSSADKGVFSHAIPRKGADPYVVQCIVNDIAWLGHTKLVLRSDNEPAMVALIAEALRGLRVQLLDIDSVASEGSVPYDPQTNGAAEVAVKLVKQTLRANQLTLERR